MSIKEMINNEKESNKECAYDMVDLGEYSDDEAEADIEAFDDNADKALDEILEFVKNIPFLSYEAASLINSNILSGGNASEQFIQELGVTFKLDSAGDLEIDGELKAENELSNESKEDLNKLYKSMKAASDRHNNTDYDEFDKSKMTDAQVKALRTSHNEAVNDVIFEI